MEGEALGYLAILLKGALAGYYGWVTHTIGVTVGSWGKNCPVILVAAFLISDHWFVVPIIYQNFTLLLK